MNYGIIPIGGKGVRLGLPFPKELLPQKGYDVYTPVVDHSITKMLHADIDDIIFVHGTEFKKEVCDYYPKFTHVLQTELGFSKVLLSAYKYQEYGEKDKFLFALPDSVFRSNPFLDLIEMEGVACGLFTTDDLSKVDRISSTDPQVFEVKSPKRVSNTDKFWGVLKFDLPDLVKLAYASVETNEIGNILNTFSNKKYLECGQYLDLGTWPNYNEYIKSW